MKIINLTSTSRMICLPKVDITLKPKSISKEFLCTPKLFSSLIGTKDYQNIYRFIMDSSERVMLDSVPCLPQVIISNEEAKNILSDMEMGKLPAKLDHLGNEVKEEDPEPAPSADPEPEHKDEGSKEDPDPEDGSKENPEPQAEDTDSNPAPSSGEGGMAEGVNADDLPKESILKPDPKKEDHKSKDKKKK